MYLGDLREFLLINYDADPWFNAVANTISILFSFSFNSIVNTFVKWEIFGVALEKLKNSTQTRSGVHFVFRHILYQNSKFLRDEFALIPATSCVSAAGDVCFPGSARSKWMVTP